MIRAFLCAILLSGCACKMPPVTVPVSCVQVVPVRESSIFIATPPDADIAEQVNALLIDRDVTEIYVGGLEAIVAGCR